MGGGCLGCCMPMGGCLGLGCCMPWPSLGGCLGLGCCTPLAFGCVPMGGLPRPLAAACPWGCLGLGCMLAHGGLPRPWLLHALALAACPWGGCLGLGCCMPMGGCLGLGCCMPWPWLVSQKMRVFWKKRLFDPKWQALGMAGCPGACPHARHAASPRIVPHFGEIGSCLFPFLCS